MEDERIQSCYLEKFSSKLIEMNSKGTDSIIKEDYYQAIVYLTEAESILEYAANYGKTIERTLILTTLHN